MKALSGEPGCRPRGLTLFGVALMAVGGVVALFAAHANADATNIRARGQSTSGQVIRVNPGRKGGGEMTVAYAVNGATYTVDFPTAQGHGYSLGAAVPLAYSPSDPGNAQLAGDDGYSDRARFLGAGAFLVIGLLLVLAGFL